MCISVLLETASRLHEEISNTLLASLANNLHCLTDCVSNVSFITSSVTLILLIMACLEQGTTFEAVYLVKYLEFFYGVKILS